MKVKVKYIDGTVLEYNKIISIVKKLFMYVYVMKMDILKELGSLKLKAWNCWGIRRIANNENNIWWI